MLERRRFLSAALVGAVGSLVLASCGSSGSGEQSPSQPSTGATWDPGQIRFAAGNPVFFDLAATLPAGVRPGGVFGLAPSSPPLPGGFSLSSNGILLAAAPDVGVTTGIVFSYAEP